MIEYHVHEITHPASCLCRSASSAVCSTLDFHPVAMCDPTFPGAMRRLTPDERDYVRRFISIRWDEAA